MTKRTNRLKPFGTYTRWIGAMFLGGILLALLAAGLMLLLSEDSGSPLPPAAGDLSTFNLIYLRAYLRFNYDSLNLPSARSDGVFEVQQGETATEICARLKQEGWVGDSDLICRYLHYTGGDRSIGSGMFLIQAGENPAQIADSLSSGESKIRQVTVFPGWRQEEIAAALPATGVSITSNDFLSSTGGRPDSNGSLASLYAEIPSWATLEGFLFPAEYRVVPGETADQFVERMVVNFQQSLPSGWQSAVKSQGLSVYQAVTLASIIQREAVVEEEMPLIASVYYNRLNLGMRLEADPTVQYALGFQSDRSGWWTNPLWPADFVLDSSYNTYLYYGLPPGPISNPGSAALQAVAEPAQTSYLFFRAACDGSGRHNFAETYIQHLANACGG
jgi:UPF0755 protein